MRSHDFPTTVALTQCPAMDKDGNDVTISGLYDIEEHFPVEPSNYVWSPFFVVYRHDGDKDDTDAPHWDVDEGHMIEQVMPKLHGQMLRDEHEMMLMQERATSGIGWPD